jgi:hypothetical protein
MRLCYLYLRCNWSQRFPSPRRQKTNSRPQSSSKHLTNIEHPSFAWTIHTGLGVGTVKLTTWRLTTHTVAYEHYSNHVLTTQFYPNLTDHCVPLNGFRLHTGHSFFYLSHWSMQLPWKLCAHPSNLISHPLRNRSGRIVQNLADGLNLLKFLNGNEGISALS